MHPQKPGRSQDDPSPAHRCDEFQPGNPWRVALQQSSPPLPRPPSGCNINSRPPSKSQRTAYRAFPNCLTQGGHPRAMGSELDVGHDGTSSRNDGRSAGLDIERARPLVELAAAVVQVHHLPGSMRRIAIPMTTPNLVMASPLAIVLNAILCPKAIVSRAASSVCVPPSMMRMTRLPIRRRGAWRRCQRREPGRRKM